MHLRGTLQSKSLMSNAQQQHDFTINYKLHHLWLKEMQGTSCHCIWCTPAIWKLCSYFLSMSGLEH